MKFSEFIIILNMIDFNEIKKLSKNQLKIINSLKTKKYRFKNNLFLVEGLKSCKELIDSAKNLIKFFVITDNFNTSNNDLLELIIQNNYDLYYVESTKFKNLSDTITPQQIIAIATLKPQKFILDSPIVILDNITDPGNLGTIIRSMDWFGIDQLILSKNCVDIFNPKVIRSTMGSIFRINYFIPDNLNNFIKSKLTDYKIIGTSTKAKTSLNNFTFPNKFAIIIGNEANGISKELMETLTDNIKINGFGKAESLNASITCSIILYEITKNCNKF